MANYHSTTPPLLSRPHTPATIHDDEPPKGAYYTGQYSPRLTVTPHMTWDGSIENTSVRVGASTMGSTSRRGSPRASSPIRKRERQMGLSYRYRKPAAVAFIFIVVVVSYLALNPRAINPHASHREGETKRRADRARGIFSKLAGTDRRTDVDDFRRPPPPSKRRVPEGVSPFFPSADPLPVHMEERLVIYHNYPLSEHRPPPNQFTVTPGATHDRPVVAIITATNNPRAVMRETAITLHGQSMQNWAWIIVNDHTTNSESLALLSELAQDPRVTVLKNPGAKGLAQGRNVALRHILKQEHVPKYLVSLDDDDLFEMTALEKVVWLLESNPEWDLGGFPYIKWGAANETVWTGLHSGSANYHQGNFVPNAAMYRSSAVIKSECRYDEESFASGGEDWDFWMCLADAGHWGGSIPEPLYWYRMNPSAFRSSRWGQTFVNGFDSLKQKIQHKHANLARGHFPSATPAISKQLERVSWTAPYDSLLAHHEKSIMFIVPWLYVGGADIGALHMVQLYAEAGYRVTVLCTLYKQPEGLELRPQVLQWTHDVHVLPSFLRAHDFPRYIKHLVDSRGINDVVLSNSQLIYEMLPALVEELPHVRFVDYLHNEAYDGWKSGGYPTYSVISQRYLARTITCSSYLRDWLIERGHVADRIGVVRLGIELKDFTPVTEVVRSGAKDTLLDLNPDTIVITVVGRLDHQKRPLLVPAIIQELLKFDDTHDFLVVMLGDGPLATALNTEVERRDLDDFFRQLGTVARPQAYLAATDIFLLPSMSEGISIAIAEAMAMGIPILTARAGALPEQLGDGTDSVGGILVNHTLRDTDDAKLYATELHKLLSSAALRKTLGQNARRNVQSSFDWRTTLKGLFGEVEQSRNYRREEPVEGTPHPAAYLALQTLLLEARGETDFALGYNNFPR